MEQQRQSSEQQEAPVGECLGMTEGTVTWYIQSGTIQGTSEQEDNVGGLIKGFIGLVNDKPWAALGEIIYASKRGFESDSPYLIPTIVVAQYLKQAPVPTTQKVDGIEVGPINQIVGGIN